MNGRQVEVAVARFYGSSNWLYAAECSRVATILGACSIPILWRIRWCNGVIAAPRYARRWYPFDVAVCEQVVRPVRMPAKRIGNIVVAACGWIQISSFESGSRFEVGWGLGEQRATLSGRRIVSRPFER